MRIKLSIIQLKESRVEILKQIMNLSPEDSITLAKRADLDELPHFAEFQLGLHCLQIYRFRDFQNAMD